MGIEPFKIKLAKWIAWRLPRIVVYFAGVRLWANATQGKWAYEEADNVRMSTILKRFEY